MKKFIMALAILAMGGSSFFGVMNQNALKDEMALRDDYRQKGNDTQDELNQKNEELEDAKEQRTIAEDERDAVSAKLSETNRSIKRQEAELASISGELESTQIKQREIDLAIEKLDLPGDIKTAAELRQFVIARKDELTETQNQKAELNSRMETLSKEVTVATGKVKELENHQVDRAKMIALNGLEATVIAVNRQWGFVMINAGKDLGVKADASMLVKRGQERIARLRIVTLEPNMLVADVVPESLAEGARVLPGDKVIFENTK